MRDACRAELQLLTTQEVAQLLQVHENRIYAYVKSGQLISVQIVGGRHRFTPEGVRTFIEAAAGRRAHGNDDA